MARKLTDDERIENYFTNCKPDEALRQLDRIGLVLRTRDFKHALPAVAAPRKRGRPERERSKPPIATGAGGAE